MKVLFAVGNDKMSESIVKQYQKDFKQIISYKNVYFFNAILKELQRDKGYDRIVISEDLEQMVNTDYEQMDKFLFDRLDSISDEATNLNGEDIPIILICTERRNKAEPILVKLFGIGIYNAIIGNDRSVNEVCRLINRPRSKKEAKIYYKIDSEDVTYPLDREDENDVSELEIQNILAHYKRLGSDEDKYVESFDSIASQYNDKQLRVISRCLPLNVRAVLEEKSSKYQQVNSYNNKISDKIRVNKRQEKKGTSEILLKNAKKQNLNEPVVVPSVIDTSKQRKIVTKKSVPEQHQYSQTKYEESQTSSIEGFELPEIELEELPEIKEIPETEYMPENIEVMQEIEQPNNNFAQEEVSEQPVKRKRGRPKKVVEEPVEVAPKRKRGRPRKNAQPEENNILPGLEEEVKLPGFEDVEEEVMLPGLSNNNEYEEQQEENIPISNFVNEQQTPIYEDEEDVALPGFESEVEESSINTPQFNEIHENPYTNVLQNLQKENEQEYDVRLKRPEPVQYQELDMSSLLSPIQKMVAFVGTSKNGTSFLVNNVAELLSVNGIDTAILDLTHNRNAYYIYTKNEEELRNQSNYIMKNLKIGKATGIQEHRNLTIYTSAFEDDEDLQDVEPIIETLAKNHTVVLMDCDFSTPMRYFKYAQEIYLVQSMDILTIQPLTAFLRQLSDKNMFDESKVRVILNKFMKTREINEELLIGGISIYNDAGMTVRKELFNRKTVNYITIPFELKTYLRYLDGLVECDVSLKGYSKEFMQSLKKLANMIYKGGNISGKYEPPSVKNNSNNTFSTSMNNTLNQMKQNY